TSPLTTAESSPPEFCSLIWVGDTDTTRCHDQPSAKTTPNTTPATIVERAVEPRWRVTNKVTAKANAASNKDERFTIVADRQLVSLDD
ncbi:MAG: hypothetical protein MK364_23660, partial [Pirellulales bacterium]|nr:hypothetical protein [Pirellulales bacterium]